MSTSDIDETKDYQRIWDHLERSRKYRDEPALETILDKVGGVSKESGPLETGLLREKPSTETDFHVRAIPRRIWETIRYITIDHPAKTIQLKSVAEGCLIHTGLNVLERIFAQLPGIETWREAYENDTTNVLLDFIEQGYKTEYLGHGLREAKKVSFLNKNDKARAMELNTKYGLSMANIVVLAMTAAICQSVRFLPDTIVDSAGKEMDKFERWLKGIKYQ
jgi:hypothetical protein